MFRELEQTDLGLYIGLREGGELDLRVAAQAALSFDTFIRLLVEIIEPGTQVELSLIKGEVGSLNLISKIRASVSKKTLKTIALLAAGWIGGETLSYGFQEFMNYLTSNLTEAQILEIGDENLKPGLFTEPCSAGVDWRFRGPRRPLSGALSWVWRWLAE